MSTPEKTKIVRRTLPVINREGDKVFYAKWVQDDGRASAWVDNIHDAERMTEDEATKVANFYRFSHSEAAVVEVIDAPADGPDLSGETALGIG